MKKLTVAATAEALDDVIAFLTEELEANGFPMKATNQILISAEEIFVNIAHYAYPNGGNAEVCASVTDSNVVITFSDNGKPFNPLEVAAPDITKSAEEREAGGLGIFMVKKMMSGVEYNFIDGRNVLTITKTIDS
ncbi:MAG: ATP-binding protein [Oscillospiraceae bacterium]|jgi:anti-sigma regulatory factor (Ser/Thr protein kinase)|nr:ATP-binding protein [Oscillospiraceae bacterium]